MKFAAAWAGSINLEIGQEGTAVGWLLSICKISCSPWGPCIIFQGEFGSFLLCLKKMMMDSDGDKGEGDCDKGSMAAATAA